MTDTELVEHLHGRLQRSQEGVDALRDLLEVVLDQFTREGDQFVCRGIPVHALRHWRTALTGGVYAPPPNYLLPKGI